MMRRCSDRTKTTRGLHHRPRSPSQKADYEKRAAAKRKENEEMAKTFGLPGLDDESNRAFAAKLMKYAGWRSVTYRGKGVFDVDYHFEGRATQDFLFPALPDNDLIIPFIAIRRRDRRIGAGHRPGVHRRSRAARRRAGAAAARQDGRRTGRVSRAEGRFTVITDGEILTNNSEDGAAAASARPRSPLGRRGQLDQDPRDAHPPAVSRSRSSNGRLRIVVRPLPRCRDFNGGDYHAPYVLAALAGRQRVSRVRRPDAEGAVARPAGGREHFVVVSTAGKHGDEYVWTLPDGSIAYRESILLRGLIFETGRDGASSTPTGCPSASPSAASRPAAMPPRRSRSTQATARWKSHGR